MSWPGEADTDEATLDSGIADSLTSREWEQLVDIVVQRLERRIADDLARRGRRHSPRVM